MLALGVASGIAIDHYLFAVEAEPQACPDCVCNQTMIHNTTNLFYNYTTVIGADPPRIMAIAINVANEHDYDPDLYDCEIYSAELVRRYRDSGYDAEVCHGELGNYGHSWVKVCGYVEPQTGEFLEPSNLREDYHLGWCA